MKRTDEEFQKRLLAAFRQEAQERLQNLVSTLLQLEQTTVADEIPGWIEIIYRDVHSLKGAARAVNMTEMEELCQVFETILGQAKRGELTLTPQHFDVFHKAADTLGQQLNPSPDGTGSQDLFLATVRELERLTRPPRKAPVKAKLHFTPVTPPTVMEPPPVPVSLPPAPPIRPTAENAKAGEATASPTPPPVFAAPVNPPPPPPPPPAGITAKMAPTTGETVRMSAKKLDSLLVQAEEMLFAKLAARQHVANLREVSRTVEQWKKEWSKPGQVARTLRRRLEEQEFQQLAPEVVKEIRALVTAFETGQHQLAELTGNLNQIRTLAARNSHSIGRQVDEFLAEMKRSAMFPLAVLFEGFPKMVRDLAKDQGKEIDLVLTGGELEIDRRILEEMKDPFVHLVRNAVDHGIESPEIRRSQGKPNRATIAISVTPAEGNAVEIVFGDDGAGIDPQKVKAAAQKHNTRTTSEIDALDDRAALDLIFDSGVSTSPLVTNLSGRGLGMAIVREKVEKVGGRISIESTLHTGTTFRLRLPITMATFRALLVKVGGQTFVVPLFHLERVLRLRQNQLETIENRAVVQVLGQRIPVARLADILNLPHPPKSNGREGLTFLVCRQGPQRLALVVDEIIDEQEILFKSLGPQLRRVRNVAGAAVLGNGQVVVILNISDVVQAATRTLVNRPLLSAVPTGAPPKTVLVAEDSITSRMLLKNILESAGYRVLTAIDGQDALQQLKQETVDILVSDVEMPRLSGFELTQAVRQLPATASLPVVLVTSLSSREHRDRGVEVGANAYIVKRDFDQSDLLLAIEQLIR